MGFSLLTQQIPSHMNLVLPPWSSSAQQDCPTFMESIKLYSMAESFDCPTSMECVLAIIVYSATEMETWMECYISG